MWGRMLVCRWLRSFYPIIRIPAGKMALSVGDWILEADSLLEKKSVNEAIDLLNRIGEPNICAQK